MKRVALTTLGCRFNQNETLAMEESLREGYKITNYSREADAYVINTCTVTAKSDHKCRQLIRNTFKRAPGSKIIITGCYAETQKKEITLIEGVTLVIGNTEKPQIKSLIDGLFSDEKSLSQPPSQDLRDDSRADTSSRRTSAYINVQTGCDMSCSYCIVTVARGRGLSKPIREVVGEFQNLVSSGVNEIVLTGINLGCYGRDFNRKASIAELLNELLQVEGVGRIRLSSINPGEVSDELIELIKGNRTICRHLHVPLQSGDNTILGSMRRNYSREVFRDLINRLHGEVEGVGLGTDIIAGFPGESERALLNTYNLIQELPLSYLHVFRYSRREGTDASRFGEQLSNAVKGERSRRLIELGEEKKREFRQGQLGRVVNVLFEARESSTANELVGYSDNYIPVTVEGSEELKNSIRPVRLLNLESDRVRGILV